MSRKDHENKAIFNPPKGESFHDSQTEPDSTNINENSSKKEIITNNNDAYRRKELEMRFENQNESNKRAMIDTQTRAAIDTMRAKADVEAQIKRVENERNRDNNDFELNTR